MSTETGLVTWVNFKPLKQGWYWMRSGKHACPIPKWVTPWTWDQAFQGWERSIHEIPSAEKIAELIAKAMELNVLEIELRDRGIEEDLSIP